MGNQQERLVDASFIAGLIVGEGTFCLGVHRRRRLTRITPSFSMQMNDGETMEIVAASLRELGLPCHIYHRESRGCWTMQAHGFLRVQKYLDVFLPFLTGKKREAAEIVQGFISSRSERKGKFDPYTEHEIGLVAKLRSINGVPNRKRTPIEDLIRDHGNRQWKARQRESSETKRLAGVASS